MTNKRLQHLLSVKRLSGWLDVKKQHLFLVLFTFFNEREILNKHGFLKFIICQVCKKSTHNHKLMCTVIYSLNYLENNRGLTCSSAHNVENMS